MADVGHQSFSKSVFYVPPLTGKSSENFQYQLLWCWLVLTNVEMLVITKKDQICSIMLTIKMLDENEFSECFQARSWSMFVTSEYVTN